MVPRRRREVSSEVLLRTWSDSVVASGGGVGGALGVSECDDAQLED
jgi:hypothetical protein